jgi:predicted CoA-substrate-specific enzyme activase
LTSDTTASTAVVGLDCGSTYSKGLVLDNQGRVLAREYLPSGWNLEAAGSTLLDRLLGQVGRPVIMTAVTGYGRLRLKQADLVITEISCHALGAEMLRPGVRTVIDIGGQDTKVMTVEGGRVRDFLMNDKCAAGTGRFLEMALKRLEMDWSELDMIGDSPVRLNSVCAVFAESEIMGLLVSGRPRQEIVGGVVASLADRAAALAARARPEAPVVLTGGLSGCPLVGRQLSRVLNLTVEPLKQGFYAGALGAAWSALRRMDPRDIVAE